MRRQKHNKIWGPAWSLVGALALLTATFAVSKPQTARAQPADLNSAVAKYPNISGTSLQSCDLCHTNSVPDLNPYGADYLANGRSTTAFGLIENIDSDGDGFTNLQEFSALTFPGNPSSFPIAATATFTPTPTATFTSIPPTATATFTLVPPTPTATFTSAPPTATATFTAIPSTPTATFTSVPATPTATFTAAPPTATPTNTSVGPTPTSTFTSVAPTPTGTFTSIAPTATFTTVPATPTATNTSVALTPTSTVVTTSGLDLDIQEFKVTEEMELKKAKPIKIWLDVENHSKVSGQGIATVIGIQDGIEIYRASMSVYANRGKHSQVSFPSYLPTAGGKIKWTVTLVDDNPDNDTKSATTKVKTKHHGHKGDKNIRNLLYK